jgi:Domain of unknown function (DUF5668)/B-box zinc finger
MNCAVHPESEATGFCRNCGKAMCAVCVRPVRDVLYCEDCLANIMGIPATPPPGTASALPPASSGLPPAAVPGHRGNSPGAAFILGFIPGLGAVYNGEYNKALIHIVVFAAMIVGLSSDIGDSAETVLGLLLAGFILYMAFDAHRTARARLAGEASLDPIEAWSKNRPVGPMILIALGALFLLNNFSWFPMYRIGRLWPLILIGVGVLLFRNRLTGRS